MKSLRRLLLFIVLNILVSAATTLIIIQWDRALHPAPAPFLVAPAAQGETLLPSQSQTAASQETPQFPLDKKFIEIQNVFGAGDLEREVVVLKRVGDGDLPLTGWKLKDDQGAQYIFPELTLYKRWRCPVIYQIWR